MLWRLLTLVASVVMAVNGLSLLGREDCETVSFDGQGGRVFTAVCHPDSSGAIPASLAGLLLLAGGAGLFWLWRRQVRRHKALQIFAAAQAFGRMSQQLSDVPPNAAELLLMSHAPRDIESGGPLRSMVLDYLGESSTGGPSSIRAARQRLTSEQQREVEELATGMVEAVQVGGQLGDGLAHATFVATMQPLAGVDDQTQLPLHRAIASAASDAVAMMVNGGRFDIAHEVAAFAGKLYMNAAAWTESRWALRAERDVT